MACSRARTTPLLLGVRHHTRHDPTLAFSRAAQADRLADRLGITVIWQEPCHEGLLAKHFQGGTRRPQTAEDALSYLQDFWPSYTKAQTALRIRPYIDLDGVRLAGSRIARFHDLLRTIGLA